MAITYGLLVERTDSNSEPCEPVPVPLTGVTVNVRIVDLVAEVNIEQRYVNREQQPIEAVYKFPLDEGAGVKKFIAEIDGRVIEGVVKETKEAQEDYQQAIQSGQTAFLLEEKLPDVFKAKVGNLPAGSGAKIRLTYVTELKVEGGEIRFFLPTTIAPRYIPASDASSTAADLATIKYTDESYYRVELNATVQTASAIQEIRSPTHKITVNDDAPANPKRKTLRLQDHETSMDRDLVIYIKIVDAHQPRLIYEKSPNGSIAMMLSLVPSFKLAEQKTELIFLVDRSGSMQGAGIEQARQALKLFLHSLPMDCYVNIGGFGFSYEELFPASRKYDQNVLQIAKSYAQSLQANLGGTEIYHPLELILKKPLIDGYLRQVFVLTDGEVSNADQVLGLVRRESGRTRVFALGLGSSASHHLVEGMARAGNGTALFASLEERLEKKVMHQLQDALQPSLTDIKIEWEGYDKETEKAPEVTVQTEKSLMGFGKPLVEPTSTTNKLVEKLRQAPQDSLIPPVFDGRHLVVYALLPENTHLPKWGKVIAESPAGPLSLKVTLNEENSLEGQLVHSLAAKKLIQLLQDREDHTEVKQEIIQLGCQYGLASRYTSYVAVDPREQKELKDRWMTIKTRDIPVQEAHGWGGFAGGMALFVASPQGMPSTGMAFAAPMARSMRKSRAAPMSENASYAFRDSNSSFSNVPQPQMRSVSNRSCAPEEEMDFLDSADICLGFATDSFQGGGDAFATDSYIDTANNQAVETEQPLTDDDKLMKLVSIQNFDGSFQLEKELAQLLNTTLDDVRQAGQVGSYSDQVWVTALALAYMTLALVNLQSSWMLVAKKAEKWLQSQHLTDEATCTKSAHDFVKTKLHI